MNDARHLISTFEPPPSSAGGPSFTCPECGRAIRSHEWTRDYDAQNGDGFALRCACGRRYRWHRGAATIETVLTRWQRQHATGDRCEVAVSPTGWFDYGIVDAGASAVRWLGETRMLDKAQGLADGAVAPHECHCPEWSGEP